MLMAATGLGRAGQAWADLDRDQRETKTLETVKLALELGADVNAKGLDGHTALDGARQLRMESVIQLLADHGAQEGVPQQNRGPRRQ